MANRERGVAIREGKVANKGEGRGYQGREK
jgi:hypothetical protein